MQCVNEAAWQGSQCDKLSATPICEAGDGGFSNEKKKRKAIQSRQHYAGQCLQCPRTVAIGARGVVGMSCCPPLSKANGPTDGGGANDTWEWGVEFSHLPVKK